ncbi:MAG: N-acetyltransferase [Chloroflexi bacterium]|nr:N-acetyltransferase [Chloroflexota bacterium]
MDFEIIPMQPSDWPQVEAIYAQGIATGNATFETTVPSWDQFDAAHRSDCRLVAKRGSEVLGWAAISPYSRRNVYAGVAEESIYIAAAARGQGVGKALLNVLIAESEQAGVWTLQAGIFRENTASIALHEKCGFRMVGFRERIGRLHGVWRDVVLLERRSPVVGP